MKYIKYSCVSAPHSDTIFLTKSLLPNYAVLPYINYRLTGVHCTDVSDASGTLLFDVRNKRWSPEMLEVCGIREEQLPTIYESYDAVGTISPSMADRLQLPNHVVIAAGAGDNAAAAVGTGTVGDSACNISLGTSGTIFISSRELRMDENNALHSFAHADGKYHLMGCMLSAASCNKWLMEEIFRTKDYDREQLMISQDMLGRNHVFFLPYLMGERSPINDTNARGTFIGMTMDNVRADLTRAMLEGVAFGIRDSMEIAKKLGISVRRSKICGGGAKSPLWRTIMANVLNIKLDIVESEEGPSMGGAMLAMVAQGTYASVEDACARLIRIIDTVEPDEEIAARYEERYRRFQAIYPSLKSLFAKLI